MSKKSEQWAAELKAKAEAAMRQAMDAKLAERALDYMRNEHPDVVQQWEQEMK
jgi:hypothetical protein